MILHLPVFYLYLAPKKPTMQWSARTHQKKESFIAALRQVGKVHLSGNNLLLVLIIFCFFYDLIWCDYGIMI
jgi:hypothetical protein